MCIRYNDLPALSLDVSDTPQPLEAFEEVYGKPDIDDLTLSVQHLQQGGGKCLLLSSESALPDMTSAGNLIVTFCEFTP